MPWLVRLLWDPPAELDLLDKDDRPDHAKIVGFVLTSAFLVFAWFDRLPDFWRMLLIAALGYGWIGLRTFLNRRLPSAPTPPAGLVVDDD